MGCGGPEEWVKMAKKVDFILKQEEAKKAAANVPHKILVMSGKGGVGKTTVAVNLAFGLAEKGYRVGILDADLHGPNAALMAGVEGVPAAIKDGKIVPIHATPKVSVLSISAFLPDRDTPIIWRGPRKAGAIQQFLSDADWDDTDVLVVDCPPGTGDEPLSVAQLIPDADGVVVVTTPQDVALLDSRKSVQFVRQVNLKVLGIVENMSGFVCPHCGQEVNLFKVGGGERAAKELGVPFLGRVPLTEAVVQAGDSGRPVILTNPGDPAAQALASIATKLAEKLEAKSKGDAATEKGERSAPPEDAGRMESGSGARTNGATPAKDRVLLAIPSDGPEGLDAPVAGHFGKTRYFTVVEVRDGRIIEVRSVENPIGADHKPGQVPKFVRDLGVDAVVAGGMGTRAKEAFSNFGIAVWSGATGTVRAAVDQYLAGSLSAEAGCPDGSC